MHGRMRCRFVETQTNVLCVCACMHACMRACAQAVYPIRFGLLSQELLSGSFVRCWRVCCNWLVLFAASAASAHAAASDAVVVASLTP